MLKATVGIHIAQLQKSIEIRLVTYAYLLKTVGVSVTATGGFDKQTLAPVAPNEHEAKSLADDLEPKVRKLVKG